MKTARDWQSLRTMSIQLLERKTGEGLETWNQRIREHDFRDEQALRSWLTKQGVSGYAQTLLVWEHFGYPAFLTASADQLIEGQYADRPQLRPIFDAIIQSALALGDVTIQARKTYVSLLTSRRTFARIQPTTKTRIDLGLRIDGQAPEGRLQPSKIQDTMKLQIGLTEVDQVDEEVLDWLRKAFEENS